MVPTTVLDTLVPIVWVWFKISAFSVLIPTPLIEFNNLTSATVAVYPLFSYTWLLPK